MENKNSPEKKMFGSTRLRVATHGFEPNLLKLSRSLEESKMVMRHFCTGCGLTMEIDKIYAEKLAADAKIELPESLEGYYIESNGCVCCDGSRNVVELKKIPTH